MLSHLNNKISPGQMAGRIWIKSHRAAERELPSICVYVKVKVLYSCLSVCVLFVFPSAVSRKQ